MKLHYHVPMVVVELCQFSNSTNIFLGANEFSSSLALLASLATCKIPSATSLGLVKPCQRLREAYIFGPRSAVGLSSSQARSVSSFPLTAWQPGPM